MAAVTQYRLKHAGEPLILYGDFNVHNQGWICSDKTDAGGILAQEFAEMFGMSQLVNFPTRLENMLDLIFSDAEASAMPNMRFGTSDHKSIGIVFQTKEVIADEEKRPDRLMWRSAPWDHIRGYLKRSFVGWTAKIFRDIDHAEGCWREICNDASKKCVKLKAPQKPKACPWWNRKCSVSYKYKRKMFSLHKCSSSKYKNAARICKRVQRKAKKVYNQGLKLKLIKMQKSEKSFWEITKEISGQSRVSNQAAPDVDELAIRFASKMSNAENVEHGSWKPQDRKKCKLSSFKISFSKVLKSLKSVDINKSINSVANHLLKNCAEAIAPSMTSLV